MKKLPELTYRDNIFSPLKIDVISFKYLRNIFKHPLNHNPFKPHRLKFNAIILITCGKEGKHNIDFKNYSYKKGSVIMISKEQIHSFIDIPKKNDGCLLTFTEELFLEVGATNPFLINHLYNNQIYSPIIDLTEQKFNQLHSLVDKIKNEVNDQKESVWIEIAKSYFKIFLLELFHSRESKDNIIKNSPYLDEFIGFQKVLQANILKERKVKFYAKKLNITTKKLNLITQSTINLSAKDFITSSVILEAKKFLKCSDMTSKEVAYHLGFDEPTNFTKFFKKHTQLLPSQFIESS